jgi:hypothetical protein
MSDDDDEEEEPKKQSTALFQFKSGEGGVHDGSQALA